MFIPSDRQSMSTLPWQLWKMFNTDLQCCSPFCRDMRRGIPKLIVTLLEPINRQPSQFVKPTCGDSDGIEIDESFLANSFLKPSFITSLKGLDGRSPQDIHHTFQVGWKSERQSFKPVSSATGLLEDNCTVYLRTADLARIGILNGDWVMIAVIYLEFQLI